MNPRQLNSVYFIQIHQEFADAGFDRYVQAYKRSVYVGGQIQSELGIALKGLTETLTWYRLFIHFSLYLLLEVRMNGKLIHKIYTLVLRNSVLVRQEWCSWVRLSLNPRKIFFRNPQRIAACCKDLSESSSRVSFLKFTLKWTNIVSWKLCERWESSGHQEAPWQCWGWGQVNLNK